MDRAELLEKLKEKVGGGVEGGSWGRWIRGHSAALRSVERAVVGAMMAEV